MKLIAIEGSGMTASVALIDEDKLICEYTADYKKTHSETLMPMFDTLVKTVDLDLSEVDAVAISSGPGSFTGLRIGSATAKGLAEALDKPVVEVPTLAAMAYGIYGSSDLIVPIMDARRMQVYTGGYEFTRTGSGEIEFKNVIEDKAVAIEDLVNELNELGRDVIFLGDGVPVMKDKIEELADFKRAYAPAGFNRQKAGNVASLGMKLFKEGKSVPASEHKPEYLRKSQAERERAEKNA